MCSFRANNVIRRFKCAKYNMLLFWNKSKIVLKAMCNVKLNVLLWVSCVVLLVFICFTWRYKEDSKLPVIVWWTSGFPGPRDSERACGNHKCFVTSERKTPEGAAFLFYGSNLNFENLPLPRNPSEIIWGLYHEESPRNTEVLMHEKVLELFNYSSTFSRHSDVPFVLQYLSSLDDVTSNYYYVPTKEKDELLTEISPILYLQTDCETMTERDEFVKELMKHINVDSYGACLNNKKLSEKFIDDYLNNLDEDDFLRFVARYKFAIAFENAACDDYITEKLWRALKVGSVPIYFGSPSIRDWLPNENSAIVYEHGSPSDLASYLKALLNDSMLYETFLEHKLFRRISNERLVKEYERNPHVNDPLAIVDDFECFVCRKLYERDEIETKESKVNRNHYDCPKPESAWSLEANKENGWLFSWNMAKRKAEIIYNQIMKEG